MAGPLDQFTIKKIVPVEAFGNDFSFTNSSLWMVITVIFSITFLLFFSKKKQIIPSIGQSFCEGLYNTAKNIVLDNVGKEGMKFFPFALTLFLFLLAGNLLGLIPGAFTFTSHLAVTASLSFFIFTIITLIGLAKHKLKFFSLFFPAGAPLWTAFILIPIEVVSYLSRPVSLSVRLFANMVAGHVLLKVVAGFIISLGSFYIIPGILPLFANSAIIVLEIMVAVIQAYVFTILTCVYLHDALYLH